MNDVFSKIAYHKNSLKTAETNVKWQRFYICRDTDEKIMWLGDGIYFWEDIEDAFWWNGNYENDTVLSALLTCRHEYFLDLNNLEDKKEFDEFCRRTKTEMEKTGSYDFTNSKDDEIKVISFFCNVFKETYGMKLLKYSFPKINGRPQYCATDNDVISDIRIAAKAVGKKFEWC